MPTALFISAGGYHHHIGMNTWHSQGATGAPADMVGLRFFTVDLPDAEALAAVVQRLQAAGIPLTRQDGAVALRDPDGIGLLLRVGTTPDAADAVAIMAALPSSDKTEQDHSGTAGRIHRRHRAQTGQCLVSGLRSFYSALRLPSGSHVILRLDGVGATGGDGRTDNRKPHPPATHPEPRAAPLRHPPLFN